MRLKTRPAPTHALFAAAIVFTFSCGTAHASTRTLELAQSSSLSAAKKKPKQVRQRPPEQPEHIACTIAGCQPTPPGCYPRMGYYSNGIPSGFDVVICPPGR